MAISTAIMPPRNLPIMIGSTSEGWKLAVNAVIAQCGLRTDAEGDAQHLIARPHAFEQVINRDDIGQHHNKARGHRYPTGRVFCR